LITDTPGKRSKGNATIFPGVIADVLALVDRWLPAAAADGSARDPVEGVASTSWWSPSWLTALGERAAERYNQVASRRP
jgi:hypothetical protein